MATEEEQKAIDRFFKYVEKLPNGCWFWNGGRTKGKGNRKWYGSFKYRGRTVKAHAFSCEVIDQRGPLPPGYDRDHNCRFSLCVNFSHVEYVTKEVNQSRRWANRSHEPGMHFDE